MLQLLQDAEFNELAHAYKQINAPNADLGQTSLRISTRALASGSPGSDSQYIHVRQADSAGTRRTTDVSGTGAAGAEAAVEYLRDE